MLVEFSLDGVLVQQRIRERPLSGIAPIDPASTPRLVTPEQGGLLRARLAQLVRRAVDNDPLAVRGVGLLALGQLLTPRRVLVARYLTRADLRQGQLVHASVGDLIARFEPTGDFCLQEEIIAALSRLACGADLEIKRSTDQDSDLVCRKREAAREVEPSVVSDLIAHPSFELVAKSILANPSSSDRRATSDARKALTSLVERRVPDRDVRAILCLRAYGAFDAVTHEVNQVIYDRIVNELTPIERRLFRFLNLRHERVPKNAGIAYDGVVSNSPFLRSLISLAPEDLKRDFFRYRCLRPSGFSSHDAKHLHRRIVGLLRFGAFAVDCVRGEDRSFDRRGRSRKGTPKQRSLPGAEFLDYFDRAILTTRQREVVELALDDGLALAEVGRRLRIDRKTAHEHWHAAVHRARTSGRHLR